MIKSICNICGYEKELSFEHVPPRSAFNDRPIVYLSIWEIINKNPTKVKKGKTSQKGAGTHTLCVRCNNNTGHWYGNAFADWAYQGMRILNFTKGKPTLYYCFNIFPLRILKQIICMFFSSSGPDFQNKHKDLVKFVLNKEEKYLPPDIKIYVFYSTSVYSRTTGIVTRSDLNFNFDTFSEITFPPFGYVMTIESKSIDERLVDISFFSKFEYNDWKDIPLQLPILPVYSYLPGSYRSKEQIDEIYDKINKK